MRDELELVAGRRKEFSGTFKRFAIQKHRSKKTSRTVLLIDVKDEDGALVTKHVWMPSPRNFNEANLVKGDRVRFLATVVPYMKDYMGSGESYAVDYTLDQPALIEKIGVAVCQ